MVDERHFERLFRDEDATPCSLDNIFHGPEVVTKNDQLSLINAFWCTTLFCVIMGLHSFVGPVFSIGIVIAVIVYLVLRIFPCNYAVTGGGACIMTSLVCLPVAVAMGGLSTLSQILLSTMMPCVAFVICAGAFLTDGRQRSRVRV